MRSFNAMLLDSYRELNSKRLFWIILGLSFIFVLFYGSIGFNEKGMTMFFGLWERETEFLVEGSPMSSLLYRGIFATFVVPLWLAWIATILALISTASIFPDFVADGSIDLVLSKPIGRVRLFLYKYFASLMFVLLQVALFCGGVFLCIGLRLSDWDWRVFLAIPIVIAFYSYLYSVCVFFGIWTRSALTALLLTFLLWFGLYAINQTEGILNLIKTQMVVDVEEQDEQIRSLEATRAETEQGEGQNVEATLQQLDRELDDLCQRRNDTQETIDTLDKWHQPARITQTVLPKTSETIGLLDRYLSREGDINLMDLITGSVEQNPAGEWTRTEGDSEQQAQRRLQEEYSARPLWYVIGTSLAFEFVVLVAGCWVFVRRDF